MIYRFMLILLLTVATVACVSPRYESIAYEAPPETAIATADSNAVVQEATEIAPTATAQVATTIATLLPTVTVLPTTEVIEATPLPQPTATSTPESADFVSVPPPPGDMILYDFTSAETTGRWFIVNDDVMGGVSQSNAMLVEPGVLLFSGIVSLDNNGGFASLRSEPTVFDSADSDAIRMRVFGDGQRYHLQVRTDNRIDGVAYDQGFETIKGEWSEVELPIADFVPQFRGRVLTDQPALESGAIRSLTLSISDKQAGGFQLLIDWISIVAPAPVTIETQ